MHTIQHPFNLVHATEKHKLAFLTWFMTWCTEQDKHRYGWLAFILTIHGCVLAPISLFTVSLAGIDMILFMLVIVSMAMSLVTNLAAMPTRITIPVFFLSVLIDLVVIVICLIKVFMS